MGSVHQNLRTAERLITDNEALRAEMKELKQSIREKRAALRRFPNFVARLKEKSNLPQQSE